MPDRSAEAAPAKINLYLHVTGRRPDGYHLLDSLVVFAEAADHLTVAPSRALTLEVTGPFAHGLAGETDNLVLRAARALAAEAGIDPTGAMTLEKRLPIASGIGGGSADAAAALRLLSRFWGIAVPPTALNRIAAGLGADVPVCLGCRPRRMSGIGEILGEAPALPDCGILLVNPGIPLATPPVFRARSGPFSTPASLPAAWSGAEEMADALRALTNDLQPPAIGLVPVIQDVLDAITGQPGCLLARMSGSGATCFGLFASAAEAAQTAARLAGTGWWCEGGALMA